MARRESRPSGRTHRRLAPQGIAAVHEEAVLVEKMAAGGEAIARLVDGRVVFVEGALPGETVRVAITTSKRDFAKGSVTEVVEASPHRTLPPCPERVAGCGGCGWQHAAPEAQLQWKAEVVADAMRRTAKMPAADVRVGGAVGPWNYRTTMRLAVAADGRVGLRAASSHRVVALASCMVAHPALAELLPHMRVEGADEVSLRVSVATGEATVWSPSPSVRFEGLPTHVAIGPDATLVERVAGADLRVSAESFFQSGPAAAELLVDAVRRACGDVLDGLRGPLLDAYGGIGLFAVHRTMFEQWVPQPVELAVADPARSGLGREATDVLAATGARRLVLVSCDPVSLARDTVLLAARGYHHAGSTVLDLFPHTAHVEVVTRFDRT